MRSRSRFLFLFVLMAFSVYLVDALEFPSVSIIRSSKFGVDSSTEELEKLLNFHHKQLNGRNPYVEAPAIVNHGLGSSPQNSSFDVSTGKRYWVYTQATYTANHEEIMNWSCAWCKSIEVIGFQPTHIILDTNTDTLAFVGYLAAFSEIIVSYRGSDNFMNWVLDLEFWKTSKPLDGIPGANTATGFYDCFKALRDGVYNAVLANIQNNPNYQVKIVGHSLGGAISSITALDFVYNAKLNVESYTFGSPRAGDAGFASAYDNYMPDYWRMTHNDDPVPHLPFELLGFEHIAHEIFQYDIEGIYIICNPLDGEDPNCADRYTDWLLRFDVAQHGSYCNLTSPDIGPHGLRHQTPLNFL